VQMLSCKLLLHQITGFLIHLLCIVDFDWMWNKFCDY